MLEQIEAYLEAAKPYWSFITQVLVIWYLGQFFKKRIWTKEHAQNSRFIYWMRTTLRLHPLIAGGLWGALYPWMPTVSFVTTRGGAINAGLLAGFTALAGHTILEVLAEKYQWTWVLKILREIVPDRDTDCPPPPT